MRCERPGGASRGLLSARSNAFWAGHRNGPLDAFSASPAIDLREIADAESRFSSQSASMLSTATPTPTRDQRLWSAEVARVVAQAPMLEPAVRRAIRTTLQALAEEPSVDPATRADVVAMLSATAR